MRVSSLSPQPNGKICFRRYNHNFVPNFSGCYVLTSAHEEIVYIGKTIDLNRRFAEHLNSSKMTANTIYGVPLWFYFHLFEITKIDFHEKSWMKQYIEMHGNLPCLNVLYAQCT